MTLRLVSSAVLMGALFGNYIWNQNSLTASLIPEPTTMILMGSGLVGLVWGRKKKGKGTA